MSNATVHSVRRAGHVFDAIAFDGSHESVLAISAAFRELTLQINGGFLEIATAFGHEFTRAGQWVMRDRETGAVMAVDVDAFEDRLEPLRLTPVH